MAGNHQTQVKNRCSCRRVRRPNPGASGGGWPCNFTAGIVRRWRIWWSSACIVTQAGGASSGPIPHGAQVATRPKRCSRFGECSLRVLGAQVLFWVRVFIWYHKVCLYRV